MIVQRVILPDDVCCGQELYYRTDGAVRQETGCLRIAQKTRISTDSYMNLFDAATWHRYTGMEQWELVLRIRGSGTLCLYACDADG